MNHLVKLITNDEGELCKPVWHLSTIQAGDPATFCTGEYFGYGQSNATFETKTVKRGGITCEKCLDILRTVKAVKL